MVAHERAAATWRRRYAGLLRLYPGDFRERFAESMEQTFADLCRERGARGGGITGFALWTFAETSAGIVKERVVDTVLNHRSLVRVSAVTATILAIPAVMMLIESNRAEKNWAWSPFDFLIMGALLFATGLAIEFVLKKFRRPLHRAIAVGVVVLACLTIWAQLAVGAVSQMIGWVTGG